MAAPSTVVPASISGQSLLDGYAPPAGYDETRDSDGQFRSTAGTLQHLIQLGHAAAERLAGETDQLVRLSGANFRILEHEFSRGRPWQLAVTPLAISSQQWQTLEAGLIQRTRLLEAVANDLLGPQKLIRDRVLPAELLFANPGYSRSFHNLPCVGPRLSLTATDLARGHDGRWVVTADRTRAPSGLGYALENRVIIGRIFPELIRKQNITRLASFFVSLRRHLESLVTHANPTVAILTPGRHSYRQIEDAYLAKYLNFTLVEGTDLAVRDGRLNLKTLGGLMPIDVLWRHVSDSNCDPLELDPMSLRGVTGLMTLARQQRVAVANGIGSTLAQMPALMPFLPSASKYLLGEPLQLASVPTYWCGQGKEMSHAIDHADEMIFRPAFSVTGQAPVDPSKMSAEEKAAFIARLKSDPAQYVASRRPQRSTTAVYHEGKLKPWYVALRTFQSQSSAQSQNGDPSQPLMPSGNKLPSGNEMPLGNGAVSDTVVNVLPGGLTRVSHDAAALDYSPVSGRLGLDTWIAGEKPVDQRITLIGNDRDQIQLKRSGSELPSRVAEAFFWLARGAERTEMIARLIRTTLIRMSSDDATSEDVTRMVSALAAMGQFPPDYAVDEFRSTLPPIEKALPRSVFDTKQPFGIRNSVRDLAERTMAVSDRISTEAYRILTSVSELLEVDEADSGDLSNVVERLDRVISGLLAFSGLIHEVVTRTHAWRFLELGRRIERAYQTAELIHETMTTPTADERSILEALLQATDSIMTYRSRYLLQLDPVAVLDLLVCDTTNPRSIAFQVDHMTSVLADLPVDDQAVSLRPSNRILENIHHRIFNTSVHPLSIVEPSIGRSHLRSLTEYLLEKLPQLSDAISARYLMHTTVAQELTGTSQESAQDPPTP